MRLVQSFVLFILLSYGLQAQDPVYSQFYGSPILLNPALSGLKEAANFGISYRNQWPFIETSFQSYNTYNISYDQFFRKYSSGIGLYILGDDAGGGILKTHKFAGIYSYRTRLVDKLFLRGGIELGVTSTRYNWDRFKFYDQIDPITGFVTAGGTEIPTGETRPDKTSTAYLDVSSGFVLYSPDYYLGFSLKHINTPDNTILGINSTSYSGLPMRWTIHGGAEFNLGDPKYVKTALAPAILFTGQSSLRQLNLGANVLFSTVFAGLWYRNVLTESDAVIGVFGFRKDLLKISYSYDYTLSDLGIDLGGSHEIHLQISLKEGKSKKALYSDCFEIFR